MTGLSLGQLTVAGNTFNLVALEPEDGNFNSLDEALTDALNGTKSVALLGPFLSAGAVAKYSIKTSVHGPLPAVVEYHPDKSLKVCALILNEKGATHVYMQGGLVAAEPRWVEVPRLAEFYAMAEQDRSAQRKAWIDRLRSVDKKSWPKEVDQDVASLRALSTPSLRLLLAYLGAAAFPATGVDQPAKRFRGAQTKGVTLPFFRYPLEEPDCYLRVITGREGKLESINAYDLGAGISLGPIQFNVHRGTLFWFLRYFEEGDSVLFRELFGPLGWTTNVSRQSGTEVPVLSIKTKSGRPIRLVGDESEQAVARNSGYFQSGVPGAVEFDQIDKSFRTDHARRFRNAIVWPHTQDLVLEESAVWLERGLDAIHGAGIPAVDTMRPDRDLFILKALLLSAFVRYSACLSPLLRALAPFASIADKLASIERVLCAGGSWTHCSQTRRLNLAERLTEQRGEALQVWEAIMRLADQQPVPPRAAAKRTQRTLVVAHEEHLDTCDDDAVTSGLPLLLRRLEMLAHSPLLEAHRSNARREAKRLAVLLGIADDTRQTHGQRVEKAIPGFGTSVEVIAEPGAELREALKPGDIILKQSRRSLSVAVVTDPEAGLALASGGNSKQGQAKTAVRTLNGKDTFWLVANRSGRTGKTVRILRLTAPGWSLITAAGGVIEDIGLAVPAFTVAERAVILKPLLSPADNAAAVSWSQQQHPTRSGAAPSQIMAALARYVDMNSVRSAIAKHNATNPGQPIALGTPPIDAAFVEAVHQFQRKVFTDSTQHDGMAGERVLDSLGLFLGRTGLESVDIANPTAQERLNTVRSRLPRANDNPSGAFAITAANWFRQMVMPSFLGRTFSNGIHAALIRRLRTAEQYLLSQSAYAGMTPVALGAALGIREFHKGTRPTAMTKSLHTFGLASDINYFGNPWIQGEVFTQVLKRAVLLVSAVQLGSGQIGTILHRLGTSGRTTLEIYDTLAALDADFRSYFDLSGSAGRLNEVIAARRTDGTPGIFLDSSETNAAAEARWRAKIVGDLANLRNGPTFVNGRDPRDGFLNLHRDLVVALRDVGCLAWGAVDFGPNASGDVMHFDCRNTGLGRIVCEGFIPPERVCSSRALKSNRVRRA